MLNAPKPVHINRIQIGDEATTNVSAPPVVATDSQVSTPGLILGASLDLSGWEAVPGMGDAGVVGNAFKVMVQGMGSGPDPAVGSRATWRRASWIWFRNTGVPPLEISFDNGNSFITVSPIAAPSTNIFEASLAFRYFYVRQSATSGTHVGAFACIVGINGPN